MNVQFLSDREVNPSFFHRTENMFPALDSNNKEIINLRAFKDDELKKEKDAQVIGGCLFSFY